MAEARAATRLAQPGFEGGAASGRVAAHSARRLGGLVLAVSEPGEHLFLEPRDYERYLAGEVKDDEPLGRELAAKSFLRDRLDFRALGRRAASRQLLDAGGPGVHTLVLTKRCNLKCLYCHASVVDPSRLDQDMSVETARRAVDLIFRSPSPTLMIEFQGGEPLLNWPVLKFVVAYAREKNAARPRELHFSLISNFSLLDDEKLDWLIARGVSLCTSLDGPADVHDANRVHLGGHAHAAAVDGLRRVQARRAAGAKADAPNAICTVTRRSFGRHREIVDQLIALGIERVQLGPLDPIGFARKSWPRIGYSSAEFAEFYGQALDYIIERSAQGARVYEKMALILLIRVLEGGHWRFPNADGICRLAYNHDGGVYTCEDGRLLANEGDDFFRIGDVATSSYEDIIEHPAVRASLLAASPLGQPQCFQCAYGAFCTVMPVYNYQTQGGLSGRMPENGWCEKMMGVFDAIFTRLQDPAKRPVLESWLKYRDS